MKKIPAFLLLFLCSATTVYCQADTVLQRYRQYLFSLPAPDRAATMAAFNGKDQWTDIDYASTDRGGWQPVGHLKRIRDLAWLYQQPASPVYHNAATRRIIDTTLQHWITHRYKSKNWWYNQIGVPLQMRDILILMKDDLRPDLFSGGLEILAQNGYTFWRKATGANLVWCADLSLHYGALTNNTKWMDTCIRYIWKEIHITTGDGVQPDYSYYQHSARLQMYHYGKAFLGDNIRLAWETRGTPWAYPAPKLAILDTLIRHGWQWMSRGIYTVPGTIDRAVSRPGTLHSADIRSWIPYLLQLFPEQAAAYQALYNRQNGAGTPLAGFRYYPRSDFAVYHQPDFTFFLKTLSSRTLPTEAINNENLQGKLLHSGDGYTIRNGREYDDLMPVWDWEKLPGITAFSGASKVIRKPFTGSMGNDMAGMSVMDYQLDSLTARKAWFFHQHKVIALIYGTPLPGTYTVLDQSRLQGEVHVSGNSNALKEGEHALKNVRWIWHHGMAYILQKPAAVHLKMQATSGSWRNVNGSGSTATIKEKVFLPAVSGMADYMITAATDAREAAQLSKKPGYKILQNTADGQAIQCSDGTVFAAFYTAGGIAGIKVNEPCLLMISGRTLHAASPLMKAVTLEISGKHSLTLQLPADGTTVSAVLPGQ